MIRLGIYEKGDKIGIYVRKLSNEHLEPFKAQLGLLDETSMVRCTSERLKLSGSVESANAWIDNFYKLSLEEQLGKIGLKYIRIVPNEPMVVVNLQYYQLFVNGKKVKSSPLYQELELLGSLGGEFTITPSVCRQTKMTKSYYESIKDQVIEVAKQADDIQGMMRPVSQVKKRKLVGKDGSIADRHPGFRTTSTPSFYRGR